MKVPRAIKKAAPRWSQRLKTEDIDSLLKEKNIEGHDLDICSSTCCIVGESWDFNFWYSHDDVSREECRRCNNYAKDFMYDISNRDEGGLKTDLNNYAIHIEEKHPELMSK